MCLTERAYQDRYWRSFPVLRKALENKEIPDRYYGITTADDNVFDAIVRILKISILVCEYKEDVKAVAQSGDDENLQRDLELLRHALKDISEDFFEAARNISMLVSTSTVGSHSRVE